MKSEFQKPSLDEIMQARYPDWQHCPIEKQEELLVDWMREQFESGQWDEIKRMLGIDDNPKPPVIDP